MSESSVQKLGLGVVGVGMVARTHAMALRDISAQIEVRGVFARNRERRESFAAEFGFPAADSLEALLADPAIEALLVLTPPDSRAEIVSAAARAGKHVLLEKPIERTTEAARAIVEDAEAAGITLAVTLQTRFRAASIALKRLVVEKTLGEIAAVQVSVPWWRPQSYYDEPGRGTLSRDGGGVLITQAIHTLDLVLWAVGRIAEVQANAGTSRLHRMEGEDFVAGGLRFENGVPGSLLATTANFPGAPEEIVVGFERGSARLSAGVLTVTRHDGLTEQVGEESGSGGGANPMAFSHEWHRALIADFAKAVQEGRPPAITGREALEVHRLIDALMLSSKERRAVRLDEVG